MHMTLNKQDKIESTDEAWEDGTLGTSAEHAKAVPVELQKQIDDCLGLHNFSTVFLTKPQRLKQEAIMAKKIKQVLVENDLINGEAVVVTVGYTNDFDTVLICKGTSAEVLGVKVNVSVTDGEHAKYGTEKAAILRGKTAKFTYEGVSPEGSPIGVKFVSVGEAPNLGESK